MLKQENLVLIGAITALTFLSNPYEESIKNDITKKLTNQGYSQIQILGYSWFGCGEGDIFNTRFTAINNQNKQVTGTACKGLFKNTTLRFE